MSKKEDEALLIWKNTEKIEKESIENVKIAFRNLRAIIQNPEHITPELAEKVMDSGLDKLGCTIEFVSSDYEDAISDIKFYLFKIWKGEM